MPEEAAVSVLAIDPDPVVLHFVRRIAQGSGYGYTGARSAEEAFKRMRTAPPDAVVMRASLPDMSGREFISILRERQAAPPVLLTAQRGQEAEVTAGLELGAVSVAFFPFTEAEFTLRLGALLRWARRPGTAAVLNVGPVTVDLEKGELLKPHPQPLTASELEILRWLLSPPGRAVTRRQIPVGTERAVDVHVAALRSKLGAAGACIETIRGIGYRFRGAACL
ncbi:MAG: response regulator transcription factor [Planctomycetes bacterium]|nr:response regulator transcription factor [Planctomycetota bacterium]